MPVFFPIFQVACFGTAPSVLQKTTPLPFSGLQAFDQIRCVGDLISFAAVMLTFSAVAEPFSAIVVLFSAIVVPFSAVVRPFYIFFCIVFGCCGIVFKR